MKNSPEKGKVRSLIFWDNNDRCWYAVALEFNLVESGDSPSEAMSMLFQAMKAYVTAIRSANFSPRFLNKTPTAEYEKLWKQSQSSKQPKNVQNTIFSSSFISVPSLGTA